MSKLNRTPFGKIIAKLIIDKGITQAQLAIIVGIDVSYISMMQTGKRSIPTDYLQKVCEYFELDASAKEELCQAACLQTVRTSIDITGDTKSIELIHRLNAKLNVLLPEDITEIHKVITLRTLAIKEGTN